MAGNVLGTGLLVYNTVVFPNVISARVVTRQVPDTAGRHTKYLQHNLTVETIFHDGQTDAGLDTDADDAVTAPDEGITTLDTLADGWQALRRKLSARGGTLKFNQKGFGETFQINTDLLSVDYGPVPEVLIWEPRGDNKAVRVVWQVEVTVVDCDVIVSARGADRLAELNYSISFDIDETGLTRRTIAGLMEIPAVASGPAGTAAGFAISNTVDRFRTRLKAQVPLGFSRQQRWDISPDKRTATFSITDTEEPSDNPYFPGVIRPRLTYRMSSTNLSFAQWDCSLSGSIEVAAGQPRWLAWAAFLTVLDSKRREALNAIVKTGSQDDYQFQGGLVFFRGMDFEEEIFGRTSSFSVRWLLHASLDNVLKSGGMWTPVTGPTWTGWRTSMTALNAAWSERGYAQMMHRPSDDAIVAYCDGAPQSVNINADRRFRSLDRSYLLLTSECPKKENSWMVFQNDVRLVQDPSTTYHRRITPSKDYSNPRYPQPADPGYSLSAYSDVQPPIEHKRTQSTYHVVMEGWAMRACYTIPDIVLLSYGGKKCLPEGPQVQTQKLLAHFDVDVYVARWRKSYILEGTPRGDAAKLQGLDPHKFGP